jgi:hypothetical protein
MEFITIKSSPTFFFDFFFINKLDCLVSVDASNIVNIDPNLNIP